MSYMNNKRNKTYKLTEAIHSFNFTNPQWEQLPVGFPNCDTSELPTREEKYLFNAIKTAWVISGGGRSYFYKTVFKHTAVGITAIALMIFLGKVLVASPEKKVTRSVSAKTVTRAVEDFVEATMSAVFKK